MLLVIVKSHFITVTAHAFLLHKCLLADVIISASFTVMHFFAGVRAIPCDREVTSLRDMMSQSRHLRRSAPLKWWGYKNSCSPYFNANTLLRWRAFSHCRVVFTPDSRSLQLTQSGTVSRRLYLNPLFN